MEKQISYSLSQSDLQGIIHDAVVQARQATTATSTSAHSEHGYLDIPELADMLDCCPATVHRYKKLGLPFYRIGRKIMFSKDQVLEFMRNQAIKGN